MIMKSNKVKHAILLIAFDKIEQILEYIDLLDEDFLFYIHIDKKSNISKERIENIRKNNNVVYIESVFKTNWGGSFFLESILFLARKALENENVNYLHISSESDLPIQSPNYIKEFFKKNEEKQFLDIFNFPAERWHNGGLERYEKYNFYDIFDAKSKFGYKMINWLIKIQNILGIKRGIIKNSPPLYAGSIWLSLTNSCMEYCLNYINNNPNFMNSLKYTFAPEEIFFQTIIKQSPFKDDIIDDNLYYIDWETRNGNSPAVLDMTDFEKIQSSKKIFARKVKAPISEELKINLIQYLKTK